MPITSKEIISYLKKENIEPVKLAIELSDACIKNKKNIIKSLCINDNSYDFKIEGSFAQCIYLYVSEDNGNSWTLVDSWSDH
jgi:hypothetical protein